MTGRSRPSGTLAGTALVILVALTALLAILAPGGSSDSASKATASRPAAPARSEDSGAGTPESWPPGAFPLRAHPRATVSGPPASPGDTEPSTTDSSGPPAL